MACPTPFDANEDQGSDTPFVPYDEVADEAAGFEEGQAWAREQVTSRLVNWEVNFEGWWSWGNNMQNLPSEIRENLDPRSVNLAWVEGFVKGIRSVLSHRR